MRIKYLLTLKNSGTRYPLQNCGQTLLMLKLLQTEYKPPKMAGQLKANEHKYYKSQDRINTGHSFSRMFSFNQNFDTIYTITIKLTVFESERKMLVLLSNRIFFKYLFLLDVKNPSDLWQRIKIAAFMSFEIFLILPAIIYFVENILSLQEATQSSYVISAFRYFGFYFHFHLEV